MEGVGQRIVRGYAALEGAVVNLGVPQARVGYALGAGWVLLCLAMAMYLRAEGALRKAAATQKKAR